MRYILIILLIVLPESIYGQRHIVVSKQNFTLAIIENSDTLIKIPVSVGKNYGNKTKKGDMRTPEGAFRIVSIENSAKWEHDFRDGRGKRKGAYGPWFFRLNVPGFKGIGIHGTCKPKSIGTRDSEGCIRLKNNDIATIKPFIYIGMVCVIEADKTNN